MERFSKYMNHKKIESLIWENACLMTQLEIDPYAFLWEWSQENSDWQLVVEEVFSETGEYGAFDKTPGRATRWGQTLGKGLWGGLKGALGSALGGIGGGAVGATKGALGKYKSGGQSEDESIAGGAKAADAFLGGPESRQAARADYGELPTAAVADHFRSSVDSLEKLTQAMHSHPKLRSDAEILRGLDAIKSRLVNYSDKIMGGIQGGGSPSASAGGSAAGAAPSASPSTPPPVPGYGTRRKPDLFGTQVPQAARKTSPGSKLIMPGDPRWSEQQAKAAERANDLRRRGIMDWSEHLGAKQLHG